MEINLLSMLTAEDSMVIAIGSPKIVEASSNETPCFLRFDRAFEASHSNNSFIFALYHEEPSFTRRNIAQDNYPVFFTKLAALAVKNERKQSLHGLFPYHALASPIIARSCNIRATPQATSR